MTPSASDRPLRVAFTTLQAGAHGEYGALLAAAVADAGRDMDGETGKERSGAGVEVLNIVPAALAASPRAQGSLARTRVVSIPMAGRLAKLRAPGRVLAALRAFEPDIIHDPVGSGVSALLPLRPLLPRLGQLVVTEHNPEAHPGITGWHHGIARRMTRQGACRIHVHGPRAFADMRALGTPEDRLVMIRHGAFDEYSAAAATFTRTPGAILVFGALRPNKGIDMLPDIMTRVRARHPEATLLVAGKRPAHIAPEAGAAIDAALAALTQMPGCTVRNDFIEDDEIPALFGGCGICFLPYRSATQSGVAMIAMTTGAPLVASGVGDIPDIVTHGETGLLAEPTPEALAGALMAALDDPQATTARAEAARSFAAEACSWPVVGAQMLAAYRAMMRG